MKILGRFSSGSAMLPLLLFVATFAMSAPPTFSQQTDQQGTASAIDRGYRTGYSDGYQTGFRDGNDRAARDFASTEDYRTADRAYVNSYGSIEDYKDGYRQGFESGYNSGYDRRNFDSAIPADLQRRGAGGESGQPVATESRVTRNIPANAILRVELMSNISTDVSQRGDPFQARVVEPADLAGAIVRGHIAQLKRPGRIKGVAELQLSFDRIEFANGSVLPFDAQVIEVVEEGVRETGSVDTEGGVKGKDSTKDDVAKVGAATAVGAVIGAIAGGGKGAAIGSVIGGGAGTGGVLSTRGKDLRLRSGQQLRIQTSRGTEA
jgi:hypothetical protein